MKILYFSCSSCFGINNLNQFIQAEKITKDINPIYGSIQKLHTRDGDIVCFHEDKVMKILQHKSKRVKYFSSRNKYGSTD